MNWISYASVLAALLASSAPAKTFTVYVGTYTNRTTSKGIYAYRFDTASGKLEPLGLAAEVASPSFLAVHPNNRFLYAVNESVPGSRTGQVSAFAIEPASGKLTPLNQVSSKGSGPCHLAVDRTGKMVIVANYNSGSVAAYPVKADGSLGEATSFYQHSGTGANPARQRGPHAHATVISPDNRFVAVNDLGLDQIKIYRLHPDTATITPNDPPYGSVKAGSGPRHTVFAPNGRFAYVVNEMASSVTAFKWDGDKGILNEIQTISDLPKDYDGSKNTGAEIAMDAGGRFVYASNRGHDSIAVFAVDRSKGTLTPVEYAPTQGKEPRNFALDPTGAYLFAANQNSDTVVLFRVNRKTGKLTAAGEQVEVGKPVCVVFVPR